MIVTNPLDPYLARIGELAHQAAGADLYLFNAFLTLTGLDIRQGRAVYYSVEAITPKKSMLERLAQASNRPETVECVRDLVKAAQKVLDERNDVAHALLAFNDSLGVSLVSMRKMKANERTTPITEASLTDAIKRSAKAMARCHAAYIALRQSHGLPPSMQIDESP